MQNNPEIESILEQASKLAVSKNHEYITLEHVMLALVKHKRFWRCLEQFGTSPEALQQDLTLYLDSQAVLVSAKGKVRDPRKTNALERVFNRASNTGNVWRKKINEHH